MPGKADYRALLPEMTCAVVGPGLAVSLLGRFVNIRAPKGGAMTRVGAAQLEASQRRRDATIQSVKSAWVDTGV